MILTRDNRNESHAIVTFHLKLTEEADELQRICSDGPIWWKLFS
jgi:hypothetical protein